MAWQDPVVNGAALVRPAIQSPGYQAGVSGWRIARDGSVDFNNGTFRGNLFIGDPAAAWVEVTGSIPAELNTYYSAHWAVASFRAFVQFGLVSSGVEYYYLIAGRAVSGTFAIFAVGWVDSSLTVFEARVDELNAGAISTIIGNVTPAQLVFGAAGNLAMNNGSTITLKDSGNVTQASHSGQNGTVYQPGYERKYDGRSMGRGLAYAIQLSGNPEATSVAGVETIIVATGNFTYRAGRAYKFSWHGPIDTTVANTALIHLRRGTLVTGGLIVVWGCLNTTTGRDEKQGWAIINNATGADITQAVSLWIQASTGNASFYASGAGQGQILCEDIGAAADFPSGSANW